MKTIRHAFAIIKAVSLSALITAAPVLAAGPPAPPLAPEKPGPGQRLDKEAAGAAEARYKQEYELYELQKQLYGVLKELYAEKLGGGDPVLTVEVETEQDVDTAFASVRAVFEQRTPAQLSTYLRKNVATRGDAEEAGFDVADMPQWIAENENHVSAIRPGKGMILAGPMALREREKLKIPILDDFITISLFRWIWVAVDIKKAGWFSDGSRVVVRVYAPELSTAGFDRFLNWISGVAKDHPEKFSREYLDELAEINTAVENLFGKPALTPEFLSEISGRVKRALR